MRHAVVDCGIELPTSDGVQDVQGLQEESIKAIEDQMPPQAFREYRGGELMAHIKKGINQENPFSLTYVTMYIVLSVQLAG